MKKWTSVLLALAMMAGFCVFWSITAAAEDLGSPEMALGTPMEITTDSFLGMAGDLAFYPAETGWYVFEGTPPDATAFLSFTVQLHENSLITDVNPPDTGAMNPILLNSSGTPVGVGAMHGSRNSGMRCLYLTGGKSYGVNIRALTASSAPVPATFPVVVLKAESVTGRGNVNAKNLELEVGAVVRADEVFASLPPYGLLRVTVQGDAVDGNLVAKKAGISILVFHDMAGTEVGRSTVTVLKWWQKLPSLLQFILRWVCFGWAWMRF
ncbi:MAG: hypothetical protein FWH26_07025 [Oscillospiraceae bacterium]|nr:hypothetical protein [Oscillospiraceae bacterium]